MVLYLFMQVTESLSKSMVKESYLYSKVNGKQKFEELWTVLKL